ARFLRSAAFSLSGTSGAALPCGQLLDFLVVGFLLGVLEKSGAWYIHGGDRLGQGKDNARDFLRENPALAREIEARIREKAGVAAPAKAAEEKADDKKVEQLPTRKRGT
ncbi:MAG: hypothetical protein ACT4P3_20220, partial [Betaproteobacteria bacterium]